MKQKSKAANITREDVQRAIKKFKESGGLITKITADENPKRKLVGARYASFEPVLELHVPGLD